MPPLFGRTIVTLAVLPSIDYKGLNIELYVRQLVAQKKDPKDFNDPKDFKDFKDFKD